MNQVYITFFTENGSSLGYSLVRKLYEHGHLWEVARIKPSASGPGQAVDEVLPNKYPTSTAAYVAAHWDFTSKFGQG